MNKALQAAAKRLSEEHTFRSKGEWVVVATVGPSRYSNEVLGAPMLDPMQVGELQRFTTPDLAIAGACDHSASRVGGGWLLNLRTGETQRFPPDTDTKHIHRNIP